jgi:hypothetical protein
LDPETRDCLVQLDDATSSTSTVASRSAVISVEEREQFLAAHLPNLKEKLLSTFFADAVKLCWVTAEGFIEYPPSPVLKGVTPTFSVMGIDPSEPTSSGVIVKLRENLNGVATIINKFGVLDVAGSEEGKAMGSHDVSARGVSKDADMVEEEELDTPEDWEELVN